MEYIAYQGQRWYQVAWEVYGTIEDNALAWLLWNNQDVFEPFTSGQIINTPPIEELPSAGVQVYDVLTLPVA